MNIISVGWNCIYKADFSGAGFVLKTAPRVRINYAGDYWKAIEWRYIAVKE